MMIHLPKDVESSINEAVLSGHFASADDLVAEIVRDYFRQRRQEQPAATPSSGLGSIVACSPFLGPVIKQITDAVVQ